MGNKHMGCASANAIRSGFPGSNHTIHVQGNRRLYPFKYKTATQPMTIADNSLIALDTF
jgi:hypothetical protein